MTTRAKKRADKERLAALEEEVTGLRSDNNGLLDILNALLYNAGGKIVVAKQQLIAADRRKIHVTHGRDAIVIETEKRAGDDRRPITERLWLPGGPT